jgi:hypothetical protein
MPGGIASDVSSQAHAKIAASMRSGSIALADAGLRVKKPMVVKNVRPNEVLSSLFGSRNQIKVCFHVEQGERSQCSSNVQSEHKPTSARLQKTRPRSFATQRSTWNIMRDGSR